MAVRKRLKKRSSRTSGAVTITGFGMLAVSIMGTAFAMQNVRAGSQSKEKSVPVVASFDEIKLPVPIDPIAAGTKLSKVKFKHLSYPAHQVPEGALVSLEGYSEAVFAVKVPANLPLFKDNLSFASATTNPVIDQIPNGMRAMTVRVDATSSVEGWAGSGSVVDVLLIQKDTTTVIAEKVKVLSAERSVDPVAGDSAPKPPSTITLLVSQEQCLAINTAIPRGKLAFALRSSQDIDAWQRTRYSPERLRGGSETVPEGKKVRGVLTVKGGGRRSQSFALTGDKWVPTKVVPDGFFITGDGQ